MKKLLFILFLVGILASLGAQESQDVVELNDGTVLRGAISEMNDEIIVMDTQFGMLELERENISRIRVQKVRITTEDGSTVVGAIVDQDDVSLVIETAAGNITVQKAEIESLSYDADAEQQRSGDTAGSGDGVRGTIASEDILLYEQQKKSVAVGMGLEVLGAGLIYADNYWLGIPLFLAQNAMLVASPFVGDPDLAITLAIGGSVLKTTDAILTLMAINSYNRELSQRIGISPSRGHGFGPTGHSIDLEFNAAFVGWDYTGDDEDKWMDSEEGTIIAPQLAWMFPGSGSFSWGLFGTGGIYSGTDATGDTFVMGLGGVGARWVFGDRLQGAAFFLDTGVLLPAFPIIKLGVYFNRFHISIQPIQPLAWFDLFDEIGWFTIAAGYDIHLGH